MAPPLLYLLKVNVALLLFYLAYWYGLRRLTFYTLNRIFLLFAIVFSSAYPLISLDSFISDQAEAGQLAQYLTNLESLVSGGPAPASQADSGPSVSVRAVSSWHAVWNFLALVFWSGVALMAARVLTQLISLIRIHRASSNAGALFLARTPSRTKSGRLVLRMVNENINPFSFFRWVYINPELHTPEEQTAILAHEEVHVRQWHTADILIGEINRIFYWFNPGAWLLITAIRENLEFFTDRKVLQSGMDAKSYQYSLVRVCETPYACTLANNFNFSHLKIRIAMMDKKPSSDLHLVKYLVLIPFLVAVSLMFSISCTKPAEDTLPSERPLVIIDGQEFDEQNLESLLSGDIKTIRILKGGDAIKVYGEKGANGVIMMASEVEVKTEKDRVLVDGNTGSPTRAVYTFSNGKLDASVSISDERQRGMIIKGDKPLILIDGKESDLETLQELFAAGKIQTHSIISGNAARKVYGEKGKNGLIKITSSDALKEKEL